MNQFYKIIIYGILLLAIIILTVSFYANAAYENFTNDVQTAGKEDELVSAKSVYVKLAETSMVPMGETEDSPEKWQNLTLDQCYDECDKQADCIGFSRPLNKSDTEQSMCHPAHKSSMCHTNRKGTATHRNHAIMYNTYLKETTPKLVCIGDPNETLHQPIIFKYNLFPSLFIGVKDDTEVILYKRPESGVNMIEFYDATRFEFVVGLEGSGTLAIRHIKTSKYLYRTHDNTVECRAMEDLATTLDKKRASMYLEDGGRNDVVCIRAYLVNETEPTYLVINEMTISPNGATNNSSPPRLLFSTKDDTTSQMQKYEYEILDELDGVPLSTIEQTDTTHDTFADVDTTAAISPEQIAKLMYGAANKTEFDNFLETDYPNIADYPGHTYTPPVPSSTAAQLAHQKYDTQYNEIVAETDKHIQELYEKNKAIQHKYRNIVNAIGDLHLADTQAANLHRLPQH